MDTMYLVGSEDVMRAGHNIASAASDMQRAADTISAAFEQQQRWMDSWLDRLKDVLEGSLKPNAGIEFPERSGGKLQ